MAFLPRSLWLVLLVAGGIIWGVTTLVHHHKVGSAEGKLGKQRVAAIEKVAHGNVADYYAHKTKGGGTWGHETCDSYLRQRRQIGPISTAVETVWADRVDRYWGSAPQHEDNTELDQKPTLGQIAADC